MTREETHKLFREYSLFKENRVTVPCSRERLEAALRECVAPDERTSTLSDTPKKLIGTVVDDTFSVYSRSWGKGIKGAVLKGQILPLDDVSCEIRFKIRPAFSPVPICVIGGIALFETRSLAFVFEWVLIVIAVSLISVPFHASRTAALMDDLVNKSGIVKAASENEAETA